MEGLRYCGEEPGRRLCRLPGDRRSLSPCCRSWRCAGDAGDALARPHGQAGPRGCFLNPAAFRRAAGPGTEEIRTLCSGASLSSEKADSPPHFLPTCAEPHGSDWGQVRGGNGAQSGKGPARVLSTIKDRPLGRTQASSSSKTIIWK